MSEPVWTKADQARAEAFAAEIAAFARQPGGNPRAVVLGLVKATGAVMVDQLQRDPSLDTSFADLLLDLARYVRDGFPPVTIQTRQ